MDAITRRGTLAALGTGLLLPPPPAMSREATPSGFAGRVFVTDGRVRAHTYLAPPQGALVTSHIVETASGLVLVDGQFAPAPARELKAYLDTLGAPIARVVLSHAHPDHWFGLKSVGLPAVHAGPDTARFLAARGAALIAERQADAAVPPIAGEIAPGEETIGGVTFRFRIVRDTEAPEMVIVEIPDARAVAAGDLLYNRVHAVVSRQIPAWIAALRTIAAERAAMPVILGGHGEPAAAADLDAMVAYLEAAWALMEAKPPREQAEIVAEMTARFPAHRLPPLLALGLSRAMAR